jgi:putative acetyltransferase
MAPIREVLSRLKAMNTRGCCLVGHPGCYGTRGFKNMPGFVRAGVPPDVFPDMAFDGHTPPGALTSHEAFRAEGEPAGPV